MNLQQFQLIPENKTQGDLINYLIFTIKKGDKDKESKIVKECLRQINLQVVSKDQCNNGTKRKGTILLETYQ